MAIVFTDQNAPAKTGHGKIVFLDEPAQKPEPSPAPNSTASAPAAPSGFLATTASNIVPSAERFATGIGETVLHPINTARAVGSLFTNPKARQAAVNFLKKRYGNVDALKHTIETDPVGFLSDVSGVLSGAGLAADAARGAALVSDATRAASVAERAGKIAKKAATATNPLSAVTGSASLIKKPVLGVYDAALGMTTGSGGRAISEARKASPEFIAAMKGKIEDPQVFEQARSQIQQIHDARNAQYREQLDRLKGSNQRVDMAPIRKTLADVLHDFNVRLNRDGTLDFSHSTLKREGASDVEDIYNDVMEWNNHSEAQTPAMLDILKRRIAENYSKSGQARAAVQRMVAAVKQQIVKEVPAYAKMSADYEEGTRTLDTINNALSTRDPAKADTALRKIMMGVREDKDFRSNLMRDMDRDTGGNLTGMASGRVMAPWWSRRIHPGIGIGADVTYAALSHNPIVLALLPLASPRIAGEVTQYLARGARAAAPYAKGSRAPLNIGAIVQSVPGLPPLSRQ